MDMKLLPGRVAYEFVVKVFNGKVVGFEPILKQKLAASDFCGRMQNFTDALKCLGSVCEQEPEADFSAYMGGAEADACQWVKVVMVGASARLIEGSKQDGVGMHGVRQFLNRALVRNSEPGPAHTAAVGKQFLGCQLQRFQRR